MTNMSVLP